MMNDDMLDSLHSLIDDMLQVDFNETPNLKAMVAIRDTLVENENKYSEGFINELVSRMESDVNAATGEQATGLGVRWAELVSRFIEVMYDNGFSEKNIVNMAGNINLKFTDG